MTTETTYSENTPKASGNVAVKWGLIGGLLSIIIGMAMFYAYGGAIEKMPRSVQMITGLIIAFGITFMGMKEKREALGGYITYGQAYKTGFMVSLVYIVITSIYTFVLFNYLVDFDTMAGNMIDETISKMKEQGNSEEQIEQAVSMSRKFMSPTIFLIWGLVANLVILAIVNLITAAIAKKNPPQS